MVSANVMTTKKHSWRSEENLQKSGTDSACTNQVEEEIDRGAACSPPMVLLGAWIHAMYA